MQSTYDSRYPTLYPVAYALPGLSPFDQREARRIGDAVARRTGTRCFYNSADGRLIWVYGTEPAGGPLGVKFRLPCGIRHYGSGDIDEMVRYIGLGKMARREKDRIAAENQKDETLAKEKANAVRLYDRRHDIENYAAFLDKKRRGTGTVAVAV